MRSAPQNRLFAAICWTKLIVSEESLCILDRAFDLRFQYRRKSSRCHREIRLWLDAVAPTASAGSDATAPALPFDVKRCAGEKLPEEAISAAAPTLAKKRREARMKKVGDLMTGVPGQIRLRGCGSTSPPASWPTRNAPASPSSRNCKHAIPDGSLTSRFGRYSAGFRRCGNTLFSSSMTTGWRWK
jgi:hypothetical protein